jgi:formylglycine-generating enzyme required for sulfatase activity
MAGNVWEWTQDWHHSDYIGAPTDGSAWDDNGRNRVVRGGGFDVEAHYLRTANRSYSFDPAERYFNVSARCAR